MEPTFDKEQEGMLHDVHLEIYGTERNPERGLLKRFDALMAQFEPINRLYQNAKWPVRIAGGAIGLVLTGWLVDVIRQIPMALGWGK